MSYQIVYTNTTSDHKDLTLALGKDYEDQSIMLKKLDLLKNSSKKNWNGENDEPIEEKAYSNAREAFLSTPGGMLKHWRLFPNTNGTVLLSPKNGQIGGISIGNDEFSYAAYVSDDKQVSGREPFTIESFKAALFHIHRILGYA